MAIVGRFGQVSDITTIADAICQPGNVVGDWVFLEQANDPYTVDSADPSDLDKMPSVGVIVSKSTSTACKIQWRGMTEAIFTGLSIGKIYFLGSDSKLASQPPAPGVGESYYVQPVCIATSATTVDVQPDISLVKRVG